mgnify:CR=1 FL=1
MDTKTALDKIKEVEASAQKIIEQAKSEAHNILLQAGQEKENMIKGGLITEEKVKKKNL